MRLNNSFSSNLSLIIIFYGLSIHTFAQNTPNILFILVDDMRFDDYHLGGHNFVETPNIDRLVKEGVQFKNMFCTTPL
jgi:N-acetylglucosamine-6-sulfatase